MSTFFLSWELWQEMTFVLGCCIVVVFLLGVGKLWRANRSMRKLEKLDEEKQARRQDTQRCGVIAWKTNDIPFGIRALQRGVEVEGIWISPADIPGGSQAASSPNLIGGSTDSAKRKGRSRAADSGVEANESVKPGVFLAQGHSQDDLRLSDEAPAHAGRDIPQGTAVLPVSPDVSFDSRQLPNPIYGHYSPSILIHPKPTKEQNPQEAQSLCNHRSVLYGPALIHANRQARRPNEEFEILPAGALGPRQELPTRPIGTYDLDKDLRKTEERGPRPGRLPEEAPPAGAAPSHEGA